MPVTFPDTFNLADYFLFDRLAEDLGDDKAQPPAKRSGFADKVALRFGKRSWTYQQVGDKTHGFAGALIDADVRRGERVLIALPDVPPFAWVFFGTIAAGAVVAMANPDAPFEQIRYLVDYTRCTAIVTTPKVAEALHEAFAERNFGREVLRVWVVPDAPTGDDPEAPTGLADFLDSMSPESRLGAPENRFRELANDIFEKVEKNQVNRRVTHRDEPAIWLFTSGSTGEPKANIHSHRDFAFNTEVYAKKTVGYATNDITVSVPRLYFGYATGTNLMFPFAVGATVGMFSERPTPESLMRAIDMYKATVVTNVPTMLSKLLEHDAALLKKGGKGLDFSSIRFSLSAGEALPEALLSRWIDRFHSDVYDGIGSAEMFHIYASNRPDDIKPGSLGRAVEGYELTILREDADGLGATPCAAGEIGVLWVKGDSVSFGYWLDRDKSWKTFYGHACRTGDLFKMDADGYLYFAGRADELIKVSGLWVAPVEVEECLMRHEAVALAAVIGVEEEGLMKTKAFVVVRDGFTANEALSSDLQSFAKSQISKHKYPRVIEFVTDVPKNDRGKVDRKALRRQESERARTKKKMSADEHPDLSMMTSEDVRQVLEKSPTVVLVPLGSVEPHGPHLPLATDSMISETAIDRAQMKLEDLGISALVAPTIPYGVTDFAEGFSGAVSVPAAALTAYVRAVVEGFLRQKFSLVCLVNNHLEPAHDEAARAAIAGIARAAYACPLEKRFARTLSDEFKKGECHAGRYETSLVLASRMPATDYKELANVPVSLSEGIRAGKRTFLEMGMTDAYAGNPAKASADEGDELYSKLVAMIVTVVQEGLARGDGPG